VLEGHATVGRSASVAGHWEPICRARRYHFVLAAWAMRAKKVLKIAADAHPLA
jgi:hypothetical protein